MYKFVYNTVKLFKEVTATAAMPSNAGLGAPSNYVKEYTLTRIWQDPFSRIYTASIPNFLSPHLLPLPQPPSQQNHLTYRHLGILQWPLSANLTTMRSKFSVPSKLLPTAKNMSSTGPLPTSSIPLPRKRASPNRLTRLARPQSTRTRRKTRSRHPGAILHSLARMRRVVLRLYFALTRLTRVSVT